MPPSYNSGRRNHNGSDLSNWRINRCYTNTHLEIDPQAPESIKEKQRCPTSSKTPPGYPSDPKKSIAEVRPALRPQCFLQTTEDKPAIGVIKFYQCRLLTL